ncbi:response regulator transcription factor [Ruminococcus sp. CLA-AA-H200]|uniref:Stage 0 sporulation protein A homolog n=1 Tax=Ruminococcus turbiniformis TaxID=2881258 RepID=A0ABS8G1M5_9FIRM|nr:response regulator transcription factor [Ruminococcus turbiniformis]MCC2255774.1 response regulator transcription factor [Ruminococcus turbiniformis]
MEQKKTRILIADDDAEIRSVLTLLLSSEGYEVIAACDGQEAVEKADDTIDLYILDVSMPNVSGFAAAAEIRKTCYAPVLFLTAYSGESDRTMGFSVGADDYIAKPFSNTDLLLRVKAHLRRSLEYSKALYAAKAENQGHTDSPDSIVYKDLVLVPDSQSVQKDGTAIALTWTEYRILELLLTHRRKIFSLENIYQSVWDEDAVGDSTIMVHIKNLRKKLGDNSRNPQYIKTAWGKGYYAD